MPIEACRLAYSGDVKVRKPLQAVKNTTARLSIQDLSLVNYKVSLNAEISISGNVSDSVTTGEVFDSYKREQGCSNYVGVLSEQSPSFKVLLFDICNNQSKDKSSLLLKNEEMQG